MIFRLLMKSNIYHPFSLLKSFCIQILFSTSHILKTYGILNVSFPRLHIPRLFYFCANKKSRYTIANVYTLFHIISLNTSQASVKYFDQSHHRYFFIKYNTHIYYDFMRLSPAIVNTG